MTSALHFVVPRKLTTVNPTRKTYRPLLQLSALDEDVAGQRTVRMSDNPGTSSPKTPLDAAQKIVAELRGMAPEHQALALKFSMETLGLQLPATAVASHMSAPFHAPAPQEPTQSGGSVGHSTDIKM